MWIDLTNTKLPEPRPRRRRIGELPDGAGTNGSPTSTTRDAAELEQQLRQRGIDPAQRLPDLADRFPVRRQDEQEWAVRLCLVEYALDKPLDFQGNGRPSRPCRPTIEATRRGLACPQPARWSGRRHLKDLLGDRRFSPANPESTDAWLKNGLAGGKRREGSRAFRATGRGHLELGSRQATVKSVFAIRLKNGDWKTIWSDRQKPGRRQRPTGDRNHNF